MELWQKYLDSTYEVIDTLKQDADRQVNILYDRKSKQFCVMKHQFKSLGKIYELLKSIENKHIPQIYRIFSSEEESIVLEEYITGQTLSQILDSGITLKEEEITSILRQLCECLSILHKQDIIHRDIKPSNIILTNDKIVKLIDFNIARQVKQENDTDTKCLGTKGFAPPEQYGFGQTDIRSDIYALGKTIELLEPKSERLARFIKKATQFSPENRYQSVQEILIELDGNIGLVDKFREVFDSFTFKSRRKIDDKDVQEILHEKLIEYKPTMPKTNKFGLINRTTDYPFNVKIADLGEIPHYPEEYQYIYESKEEAVLAGLRVFEQRVYSQMDKYIFQALKLYREAQLKNYYEYEISRANYYHKTNREIEGQIEDIFKWLRQNGVVIDEASREIKTFDYIPVFDTAEIKGSHIWNLKHFEELGYIDEVRQEIFSHYPIKSVAAYEYYIKTNDLMIQTAKKVEENIGECEAAYDIFEGKRYAFHIDQAFKEMLGDIIRAADLVTFLSNELRADIYGAIEESYLKGLNKALAIKANELQEYIQPYLKK